MFHFRVEGENKGRGRERKRLISLKKQIVSVVEEAEG